uniref:Uncharacterized protein n=1 Tax=Steinernema glaseri TaxID=37863 RepID=A0A1I7ZII0_9BILA
MCPNGLEPHFSSVPASGESPLLEVLVVTSKILVDLHVYRSNHRKKGLIHPVVEPATFTSPPQPEHFGRPLKSRINGLSSEFLKNPSESYFVHRHAIP